MTPDHHEPEPSSNATKVRDAASPLYFVVAALLWTLTIAALGYWHYDRVAAGFQATAASAARQSIEKDKIYRLWAAEQGGGLCAGNTTDTFQSLSRPYPRA